MFGLVYISIEKFVEYPDDDVVLGMDIDETDSVGFRGTNQGSKLAGYKRTWGDFGINSLKYSLWFSSTGFNAMRNFIRFGFSTNENISSKKHISSGASYWTSSVDTSNIDLELRWGITLLDDNQNIWIRRLDDREKGIGRWIYNKTTGICVRCLKD